VHDRRIDGQTHTFGNAGGLMMNAMTWWDHETNSIWSQPWGRSIEGPYKGAELFLLPSQITTWANWKAEHPETLAMTNNYYRVGFRQKFDPDFVIGLILAGHAKAYYYRDVEAAGLINDMLGTDIPGNDHPGNAEPGAIPIFIWAAAQNFHAYIRQVEGQTLNFRLDGDLLIDQETNSTWDITRGLATAGPLKGQSLQPVPSTSAFDWAWEDFFPDTGFYAPK
jgi:hypothetical protein